jgi:hypothetical protein
LEVPKSPSGTRSRRLIALVQAEGIEALRRDQADATRKAQDQGDIFESKTADEESTEGGEDHDAAEDAALGVTTAGTLADLMVERDTVDGLVRQADTVLARGNESKFEKLLETMREPQFRDEKMLIFTEHRDTANYLANRLEAIARVASRQAARSNRTLACSMMLLNSASTAGASLFASLKFAVWRDRVRYCPFPMIGMRSFGTGFRTRQ